MGVLGWGLRHRGEIVSRSRKHSRNTIVLRRSTPSQQTMPDNRRVRGSLRGSATSIVADRSEALTKLLGTVNDQSAVHSSTQYTIRIGDLGPEPCLARHRMQFERDEFDTTHQRHRGR